ncbi:MAG: hypothetical protein ISS25_02645 [Nanoarchaeota archaeon]|nr:hypothetical protein [DPANN group archaeon]MBL7116702.1 hypothetical protein [Nanoarchaeota archaeon]
MKNNFFKGGLDLLIIDIDDTFIYHRTVAVANRIFLKLMYSLFQKEIDPDKIYTTKRLLLLITKLIILNFFRFKPSTDKIKKLIRLSITAFYLHILQIIRETNNRFFNIISNEKIIQIWIKTVISNEVEEEEFQLSKTTIKNNLNKEVLYIYNSLKSLNPNMKIIAISQNFVVEEDPIKKILKLDMIKSNKFISDEKGTIKSFELNVKNKEDKKTIADKAIKKFRSRNIGLFIEDYDDIYLLELKNLRFVLYKKKLKRFICNKKFKAVSFR